MENLNVAVNKKHNFSAGPAILPQLVFEKAAQACLDYNGMGLSLLEMSHRSKEFVAIMEEARELSRKLYNLGDEYNTLFLQGGASTQFAMIPFNFLPEGGTSGYVDTGSWASKAVKEASHFGTGSILASSKDKNYNYIPKGYDIPNDLAYLHVTSNNTIFGTEIWDFPKTEVPVVVDMSSDLYGREVDASQFDLIYAGAQKNLGPAGTTMVILKKSFLEKQVSRNIPSMLNYNIHLSKDSMFNTPPAFAVYVCLETMRWIEAEGGIGVIEGRNKAKATLLYNEIDNNPLFEGVAVKEDRSIMNATFTITNADLEAAFLEACVAADINGIKGHRSVGGFRASMYNAMTIESVQVLVDVMKDFTQKHG